VESAASAPYRAHPAFAALEAPHCLVHDHGKRAAALFEAGKTDEALAEIAAVETASAEVLRVLDALQRG
jgi:methyl-accepting chemotaxis protein